MILAARLLHGACDDVVGVESRSDSGDTRNLPQAVDAAEQRGTKAGIPVCHVLRHVAAALRFEARFAGGASVGG